MNASTIIEILEPLANAAWWRVLVRQSAELARLRAESDQWRAIAWKAARAGDDPARDQAFADESDRQSETYRRLTNEAWSRYWTAARAIRDHFPNLLEALPVPDGIRPDEIDPIAAARAVQGLIGKLLSVESSDGWLQVHHRDCEQDNSTLGRHANDPKKPWIERAAGGLGWYQIRQSRWDNYRKR